MSLWRRVKNLGLRTKFVLPVASLLVLATGVISGYLIQRQAEGFRRELQTSGETMIRIIAINAESGVLFESKYELDELLNILAQFEAVTYSAIADKDGAVLARTGQWDEKEVEIKKILVVSDQRCRNYHIKSNSGAEYIEFNYPVVTRKEKLTRENLGITAGIDRTLAPEYVTEEIGSIKLILSLEKANKSIADAQRTAFMLMLVVLAVSILVLAFFTRVVTEPVKMLVQITDQVSRGDLSRRVVVTQHDEIGHLANTFNKMIESLKQSRNEIEEYNRTLEQKIEERTRELEQAQAQLIQSEKLSAIGQLAAGVAHELNNPLGGILGYAQFALEKIKKNVAEVGGDKDMEKYSRYLADIEAQARRCKSIVQNLLRFSRASHITEFEEVDVNKVVEDTITFVEHQLHMNQIELKVGFDPNLPKIRGHAGQLQQVFTNLIINAMHASPPESEIKVISRHRRAMGEFGGAVELLFIDQGCGIPPDNMKKIFEPFFTTKGVGKGTGLGLSVSYGIVKSHGGEIRVDSLEGHGSTFSVILPVQKPPEDTDKQKERVYSAMSRGSNG